MPRTILRRSQRLLRDDDPVFLELFLGLYALASGGLLYFWPTPMIEPAIRAGMSFGPPRWFWALIFAAGGLVQVLSTLYEARWFSKGSASFLTFAWVSITIGAYVSGVWVNRPMAIVTPALFGCFEFVVFLKQSRLFHEGR